MKIVHRTWKDMMVGTIKRVATGSLLVVEKEGSAQKIVLFVPLQRVAMLPGRICTLDYGCSAMSVYGYPYIR